MAVIEPDSPVEVTDLPNRSILILFGSETGNSQDIAGELGKAARRLHFQTKVEEMNLVSLNDLLQHTLVVLVISTTGQGDMPQNSLIFWRSLLRKRLPPGCLSTVNFTTFGLGDSSYPKFNWAARKLHKRLEQLGAVEFFPRGEGDEQADDGIDQGYLNWSADLHKYLLDKYPLPPGLSPIPAEALLPPIYGLSVVSSSSSASPNKAKAEEAPSPAKEVPDTNQPAAPLPQESLLKSENGCLPESGQASTDANLTNLKVLSIPEGLLAVLDKNERITPKDHWQDVRRITFQIHHTRQTPLSINPGDCLRLYPRNDLSDASQLIQLQGWESVADEPVDLRSLPEPPTGLYCGPFTTIRALLTNHLDITAIPRRSFLEAISHHCTNSEHKERLLDFTKPQFIDEYYDYATRPRRTILEVLEEFHSVRIPPSYILDVFPVIRGRDFSIASIVPSPSPPPPPETPGTIHLQPGSQPPFLPPPSYTLELLVALVKYRTVLRKTRTGLCSRYLSSLPAPTPLLTTHKPSLTRLHGPIHATRPLCAIATGTGIAPVRSLIQERLRHHPQSPGSTILFFGNRSRESDFFFRDEWASLAETDGTDFTLFTAFSRDQESKIYVQDVLRQQAEQVARMVREDAIFMVCGGSTKMAMACRDAVVDAMLSQGICQTQEEANERFPSLTWWQEIW